MSARRIAGLCWLLGGAVWVARWQLSLSPSATDTMRYAGLALVGVGLLIAGASLVKRGTWWLRGVAAVGAAGLTWSVAEVFRPTGEALMFDGGIGIVAVVVGLFGVATGRRRTSSRVVGSHAR